MLNGLARGQKPSDHVVSMPPAEDWAATLRTHLKRAKVARPALFESSPTVKRVDLYSLRHTGITWRTIRGDDARVIQRHAGHEKYSTTEGYVHEAEDYRGKLGTVFPPVLSVLAARAEPAAATSNRSGNDQSVKITKKAAKNGVPKGIRTVMQLAELPAIRVTLTA